MLTPELIERIRVMSSATLPRRGSSSLNSMPHWPCFENFQGEPKTFEEAWARLSYLISPGKFLPSYLVSMALGSKRSICEGPPIMKREIMAFALGWKCGSLTLRSNCSSPKRSGFTGAARSPSFSSKEASARVPSPKPFDWRKWRREQREGGVIRCKGSGSSCRGSGKGSPSLPQRGPV